MASTFEQIQEILKQEIWQQEIWRAPEYVGQMGKAEDYMLRPIDRVRVSAPPIVGRECIAAVIERTLEVLETADDWTQGKLAVDEREFQVDPASDRATQWCMLGALERATCLLVGLPTLRADPRVRQGCLCPDCQRRLYVSPDSPLQWVRLVLSDTVRYLEKRVIQTTSAGGVAAFNDSCHTTFEDVRLFLKEALHELP